MIKRVCVLGAGTMGSGIAQVTAQAGYSVTMIDISQDVLKRAMAGIERSLSKMVKKGSLSEQAKVETIGRISSSADINGANEADLVIEAISEELTLKVSTFKQLDHICPDQAILASNTSALPISALAAATQPGRQGRVIGIHFMNPAPVMKGVEIIVGRHTAKETVDASNEFVKSLGKEPCEAVDYAGFIVSRILGAMMNEGIRCVMDGNKPEQVDKAMRDCANLPMGPLELCDLVGADILLHGSETIHAEFGDRALPPPLLVSMVRAGDLGRKTGRGFYDYAQK